MRPLWIATALAVCGFAQPPRDRGPESANPFARDPEAIEAGKKRFATACSACHGMTGQGGRGPNLAEGRAVRRLRDDQLFQSIQKGLPGTDMPPSHLPDNQVWQLVTFVRSLSAPAFEMNVPGNVNAGAGLFFGSAGCAKCHMIGGKGGFLGPDLSNIGMLRPTAQLREGLLDPSARLREGFQGVRVTMRDGAKVTGVCKTNTNYLIQVLDPAGQLHRIEKSDVQEIVFRQKSVMPGDYAKRLKPGEIDDVLAFLSRQALRPANPAAPGSKGK